MDEINLKQIITEFPDCVTNGIKLKAILLDAYPEVSKGIINAILIISNSGIAKEIQNFVNIDKIEIDRWLKKLENDYCMSGSTVEKCLQLWINAFSEEEAIPWLSEKPSASDEEMVSAIKYGSLKKGYYDDLQLYVKYCFYVIKNMPDYRGDAYYQAANQLHKYDLVIREKEIDYTDEGPYYVIDWDNYVASDNPPSWKDFCNEIAAIKVLLKTKTNNINLIIENLLTTAVQYGCAEAAEALEETYLNLYPYEEYYKYDPYDEHSCAPWFDITVMDKGYNCFDTTNEIELKNSKNIDENTQRIFALKALELLRGTKDTILTKETSITAEEYYRISTIAEYYKRLVEILGDVVYKTELPFIKIQADKGNSNMIELILDLYSVYSPSDYFVNLIKYGENGDYKTQCKLADHYNTQFNNTNLEKDFQEASKWYELAIDNKARDIDSSVIKDYKKMLEKYDAKKYADIINDLQEKIDACSREWDWRMRYV